jgi:hypothetical protein
MRRSVLGARTRAGRHDGRRVVDASIERIATSLLLGLQTRPSTLEIDGHRLQGTGFPGGNKQCYRIGKLSRMPALRMRRYARRRPNVIGPTHPRPAHHPRRAHPRQARGRTRHRYAGAEARPSFGARSACGATTADRVTHKFATNVIDRPETERYSRYSQCTLPDQFDAFVWFDTAQAFKTAGCSGRKRVGSDG